MEEHNLEKQAQNLGSLPIGASVYSEKRQRWTVAL